MPSIEIVDTGLIYRNPKPALRSLHAYFPSLVCMPGGGLVATMDIGSAFEAVDMRSYVCRSDDEGKSWSEPVKVFEPDESSHPVSVTCRVGLMSDGSLMGWVALFDRSDTDMGLVHPDTEGFVATRFAVVCSTDGGRTWSEPHPVKPPYDWISFEPCSPPVSVGGHVLLPTSPLRATDGALAELPNGIAFISEDNGRSWPNASTIFADRHDGLPALELKLAFLPDGRVLAVCWSFDRQTGQPVPNRWAFSTDGGYSFSEARSTGIKGETCTPIALGGNRVLCVYRGYDPTGLRAQLAEVQGDQWKALEDVPVWSGPSYGQSEKDSKWAQISTLRLGLPSLTRLPNGDVLAAFWCVEDCVGNIRWYRLRVE